MEMRELDAAVPKTPSTGTSRKPHTISTSGERYSVPMLKRFEKK